MNLREWHCRLEDHFGALRVGRTALLGDEPIFALEHGMDEVALEGLAAAVRAHVLSDAPSWEHRLVWTVYATEIGYRYSGDEYWQTFEARTPGWIEHGHRDWIRRCFLAFQQAYSGAKPTGPWARHFSIICWPITHAILPCDLQQQLAKLLFELRLSLPASALSSPGTLGEALAVRSWSASSRFRQLAQEPGLLGQIAAALLLPEDELATSRILPTTLARIADDLTRERNSRAWLSAARQSAQSRTQTRLLPGFGTTGTQPAELCEGESRERGKRKFGIEPRLMLRPAENQAWDVLLEIPDFARVLELIPDARNSLLTSRCHVAGSSGRPLARGQLLYGPQRVQLRNWPAEAPLLTFEPPLKDLADALSRECALRPGPTWLFKIATDGLAHELRSAGVRPGSKYLLVSTSALPTGTPDCVAPVVLNCEGVSGLFFELSEALTLDLVQFLQRLGVARAGTIHVWPSGLMPAWWDGEGRAEWLCAETPLVGIGADHPIKVFVIEMGTERIELAAKSPGDPVFIEISGLDVGLHILRVSAISIEGDRTASTELEIQIREPRTWKPGNSCAGPMLVVVDPSAPSLEDLWEGHLDMEIHGPPGQLIEAELAFYPRGNTTPSLKHRLRDFKLPVTASGWRAIMKQVQDKVEVQDAYDLALRCELHLRAGECGTYTLTAERESAPVRWAVRGDRKELYLRAIDDTGREASAEVLHYAFDVPDLEQHREAARFATGMGERASGGLYVLRVGEIERAIIVPAEVRTLADLRLEPRLDSRPNSSQGVVRLLQLFELWGSARLAGNLISQNTRKQVLEKLLAEIFWWIGSHRWGEAEQRFRDDRADSVRPAKLAVSGGGDSGFAAAIALAAQELAAASTRTRVLRLADLGRRFLGLPSADDRHLWLAEFALRLASEPMGLIDWAGDALVATIEGFHDGPIFARGARFMVLVIARVGVDPNAKPGLVFDGWDWA